MDKTRHEIVHEYRLDEGEWPDLQDSSLSRRYVVRPMRVKIYQVPRQNLVRGAVVEGPQVRRDGEYNQRSGGMILVGHHEYYDAAPPPELDKLLEDEGLIWLRSVETDAP